MFRKLMKPISFVFWFIVIYFFLCLFWQVAANEPIPIVFGWGITTTTEDMGDELEPGTLITVNDCGTYAADEIIVYLNQDNDPILLRLSADASGTTEEGYRIVGKVVHQFRTIEEAYKAIEGPALIHLLHLTNLLEDFLTWLDDAIHSTPSTPETTEPTAVQATAP